MTRATPTGPQAVLITGTVGVGKSTTAEAMGTRLTELGVAHAVLDLDEIRRCWPSPAGDPFNLAVTLVNLADLARNFVAAGARVLVLAGVVETLTDRRRYADAVQLPLTVCRLSLDLAAVRARIAVRHADDHAGRRWHLDRSGELEAILDAAAVEDVMIHTAGLGPAEAAARVLDVVGLGSAAVVGAGAPEPEQTEDR